MYRDLESRWMENNTNQRFWADGPSLLVGSTRSVNASTAERGLLLGVMATHLGTLDARDNDSRTVHRKTVLWEQVTRHFNSRSSIPRSRHQIQTLYKNMKAKAKKYQSRIIEAQMENVPAPEADPVSQLLLQLLAGEFEHKRIQLEKTALFAAEEIESLNSSRLEQLIGEKQSEENDFIDGEDGDVPPNQLMEVNFSEEISPDIKDEPIEASSSYDLGENSLLSENSSNISPDDTKSEEALNANIAYTQNFTKSDDAISSHETTHHPPYLTGTLLENLNSLSEAVSFSHLKQRVKTSDESGTANDNADSTFNPFSIYSKKRQRLSSFPSILDGLRAPLNGPADSGKDTKDTFSESKNHNNNLPKLFPFSMPQIFDLVSQNDTDKFGEKKEKLKLSGDSRCCCPELHSEMLSMLKVEHKQRVRNAQRDIKEKHKEHVAKTEIYTMQKRLLQNKLNAFSTPNTTEVAVGCSSSKRNCEILLSDDELLVDDAILPISRKIEADHFSSSGAEVQLSLLQKILKQNAQESVNDVSEEDSSKVLLNEKSENYSTFQKELLQFSDDD